MTVQRTLPGAVRGGGSGTRRPKSFTIVDPPPEPRPDLTPKQRWRLYLAVPASSGPGGAPGGSGAWNALLEQAGLPLAASSGSRARIAVAAQLSLGIAGAREIVDVFLAERRTTADVRAAIERVLHPGLRLVDLHDVWVGAPGAAATTVAADYRADIAGAPLSALISASHALMGAATLPRVRRREKKATEYDLRPLLLALRALPPSPGAPVRTDAVVEMRLRHGPDAVGRPDEVLAALAEALAARGDPAVAPGELAVAPGELAAPAIPAALDVLSVTRTGLVLEGSTRSGVA